MPLTQQLHPPTLHQQAYASTARSLLSPPSVKVLALRLLGSGHPHDVCAGRLHGSQGQGGPCQQAPAAPFLHTQQGQLTSPDLGCRPHHWRFDTGTGRRAASAGVPILSATCKRTSLAARAAPGSRSPLCSAAPPAPARPPAHPRRAGSQLPRELCRLPQAAFRTEGCYVTAGAALRTHAPHSGWRALPVHGVRACRACLAHPLICSGLRYQGIPLRPPPHADLCRGRACVAAEVGTHCGVLRSSVQDRRCAHAPRADPDPLAPWNSGLGAS